MVSTIINCAPKQGSSETVKPTDIIGERPTEVYETLKERLAKNPTIDDYIELARLKGLTVPNYIIRQRMND